MAPFYVDYSGVDITTLVVGNDVESWLIDVDDIDELEEKIAVRVANDPQISSKAHIGAIREALIFLQKKMIADLERRGAKVPYRELPSLYYGQSVIDCPKNIPRVWNEVILSS